MHVNYTSMVIANYRVIDFYKMKCVVELEYCLLVVDGVKFYAWLNWVSCEDRKWLCNGWRLQEFNFHHVLDGVFLILSPKSTKTKKEKEKEIKIKPKWQIHMEF